MVVTMPQIIKPNMSLGALMRIFAIVVADDVHEESLIIAAKLGPLAQGISLQTSAHQEIMVGQEWLNKQQRKVEYHEKIVKTAPVMVP